MSTCVVVGRLIARIVRETDAVVLRRRSRAYVLKRSRKQERIFREDWVVMARETGLFVASQSVSGSFVM